MNCLSIIVFGEMTAWAVMCATVKPNQVQLPVQTDRTLLVQQHQTI